MKQRVAVVTYETPHARGGGIAAVLGHQPALLRTVLGQSVPVITPRHRKAADMKRLPNDEIRTLGSLDVRCPVGQVVMEVQFYNNTNTYFLDVADPRLTPQAFPGDPTPYSIKIPGTNAADVLLRDALLFGVGVPRALKIIDPDTESWILLLQDWQAATVAFCSTEHALFLTLHNSYDSGAVPDRTLRDYDIDPALCPGPVGTNAGSVLERAIPRCRTPIFTVSQQFAADLTTDTFQTRVMADHLQRLLSARGVQGIDNGPFVASPPEFFAALDPPDPAKVKAWKSGQRALATEALREFEPGPGKPRWGDTRRFDFGSHVWFIMAGRDDTRQKGYDVAASAVRVYLSRGGKAQFLFYPIPGDEGADGLSFLERLALDFPEHVLVFPGFFPGFEAVLRGASFGLMPSLYEPFGMANEFYLKGVAVVARTTGGIIQQVVPLRACGSFSAAVWDKCASYYSFSSPPTGILFREADDISARVIDWKRINTASYLTDGRGRDRLQDRENLPLFQSMSEELCIGIADAVRLSTENPQLYFSMIIAGALHVQRSFSWVQNANQYARFMQGAAPQAKAVYVGGV